MAARTPKPRRVEEPIAYLIELYDDDAVYLTTCPRCGDEQVVSPNARYQDFFSVLGECQACYHGVHPVMDADVYEVD